MTLCNCGSTPSTRLCTWTRRSFKTSRPFGCSRINDLAIISSLLPRLEVPPQPWNPLRAEFRSRPFLSRCHVGFRPKLLKDLKPLWMIRQNSRLVNLFLSNQTAGWLHEIQASSIIVSCSSRPADLEQVTIEQSVLLTKPMQTSHQLPHFWLPLWQRDDSHLLSPEFDAQFDHFLEILPNHCIQVDATSLAAWQTVIKGLRWNASLPLKSSRCLCP